MSTSAFASKKKQTPLQLAVAELKDFNETFLSFIGELVKYAPDDKDLPSYQIALEVLASLQKFTIIEMFNSLVVPHHDKIKDREENFFLQDVDYSKIGEINKNSEAMRKIFSFKGSYSKLSADQKTYIFEMLDWLCHHAKEYNDVHRNILEGGIPV